MNRELQSFQMSYRLTDQEVRILQLVAKGDSNKEIGAQLGISVRTVEAHRLNLMRKMEVNNVVKLIRKAIEYNLI